MAIIVRSSRVNPKTPATFWVEQCINAATKDSYGNIFRIIRLYWRGDANHKMTPYAKTKGFEDAEISMDGQGFIVDYRRNGSLWWQQAATGIGPYFAECPMTDYNIRKLASCFGDKLWTFSKDDKDVEQVVKNIYEKKYVNLSEELRKFNEARIRGMHTHRSDGDVKINSAVIPEIENKLNEIKEMETDNLLKAEELRQREANLDQREENLVTVAGEVASAGISIAPYGEEYLKSQKYLDLKRIAKEVGIKVPPETNKDGIIAMIIKKQTGEDIQTPVSKPDTDSLES